MAERRPVCPAGRIAASIIVVAMMVVMMMVVVVIRPAQNPATAAPVVSIRHVPGTRMVVVMMVVMVVMVVMMIGVLHVHDRGGSRSGFRIR